MLIGLDAVGIATDRIALSSFLLRRLDLGAHAAQFVGKSGAVARDVLQHRLEDQAGDGVQVAGKGVAAEPQRLQRNRTAASEGINYERRFFRMCRLRRGRAQSRESAALPAMSQFAKSPMKRSNACAQFPSARAESRPGIGRRRSRALVLNSSRAYGRRRDLAIGAPTASRGTKPAGGVPTRDASVGDGRDRSIFRAPRASKRQRSGNRPRRGACIRAGSSARPR